MTGNASATIDHDVVIIGDGPAGRALGAACVHAGVDAVVLGDARPWHATYGAWADEVGSHTDCAAATMDIDVVGTPPRRRLDRTYLIFDNELLSAALDVAPRLAVTATSVQHRQTAGQSAGEAQATVHLQTGERLQTRIVVDATGPAATFLARRATRPGAVFQSAYGLVLDGRPDVGGDAAVLMDWRSPAPLVGGEPTFLYLVDLGAGRWLVEETSLARRTPMPALELRGRLAARLGRDLTDVAERVEHVVIPMWPGVPARTQLTVGFGAAAGFVHPATGYSVSASLAAAPRVAAALRLALDADHRAAPAASAALGVWNAIWPGEARRARALHDYGSAALLRLPPDGIQAFFDAFFDLPTEWWAGYLRVETTATDVARVMSAVFSAVPWTVRRRLAAGNPVAFARLLQP